MREESYFINKLKEYNVNEKYNYTNLKINFRLSSPICLTAPFMYIDSLIDYLQLLDCFGTDFFIQDKRMNIFEYYDYKRIYDRFNYKNIKIAKCSTIQFKKIMYPKTEIIYKRFEDKYCNFFGKIRIGMGAFKSFAIKHVYLPVNEVEFYIRADKNKIEELFEKYLYAIGKFTRIGYGKIKSYNIEEINQDYSLQRNNIAMRTIPKDICKKYNEVALLPISNPYWKECNLVECVIPGTEVEL